MGLLVIDRRDCRLDLDGKALAIRSADAPVRFVPMALVDRVVLHPDTRLSSGVLAGLAAHDIGILLLGGRRAQRVAHVLGASSRDVRLRITQVRRLDDAEFTRRWCRTIVAAKLKAQLRLLECAQRERQDLRKPMHDAIATLHGCLHGLDADPVPTVDAIRGLEGAGAAAHFRAYARLFAPSLGFTARRRRPPPDPVNACLSLGYTLLHAQAVHACHLQGLDPMLGYLHAPVPGRASLACDLMEPWRARVDRLVWTLFRERILTPDHFGTEGSGACLLAKAGRSQFYAHWAQLARPLQRAMRRQALLATRSLGDLAAGTFDATGDDHDL